MCEYDSSEPLAIPLRRRRTKKGLLLMDYSILLGKVTQKRNGEHLSSRGFTWPISRTVHDSNALVGDHGRALHFTASPASAHRFNGYGSHRLGVLPAPQLWDPLDENGKQLSRCYHSSGGVILLCMDCDNYQLDVLENPDFWQDLKQPGRLPGGLKFSELLASDSVWHKQVALSCN